MPQTKVAGQSTLATRIATNRGCRPCENVLLAMWDRTNTKGIRRGDTPERMGGLRHRRCEWLVLGIIKAGPGARLLLLLPPPLPLSSAHHFSPALPHTLRSLLPTITMSSTTYKPFLGAVKVGDTATSAEGVTSSSLAVQYKDEEGALQTFVADQASLTKLIWGRAEHVTDEADINAWDGSQIAALVGWMEAVPPERYNDLCLLEINSAGTGPTNDASPRAKGHLMVFRQTVPVGGTVTSEICHMCDLDLAEEVDRPETTVENNRALYSRGMSGDYYVPLSKRERIRFPVSGTLLGHVVGKAQVQYQRSHTE